MLYIVAIGWLYVVLMMSITEQSAIAGLVTFLLYGVFPLAIILYLMDAPRRKRERRKAEQSQRDHGFADTAAAKHESGTDTPR